jgi:hypothetical protein
VGGGGGGGVIKSSGRRIFRGLSEKFCRRNINSRGIT